MSRTTCGTTHLASRFPRVSGDEPFIKAPVNAMMAFSPRERG